jgi:hypothetical protein
MSRKRYELSFDTQVDADYIALIEECRAAGRSVMDIMRLALDAVGKSDGPTTVRDSAELDTLRTELSVLRDAMTDQSATFNRQLDALRRESDALRVSGAVDIESEPVTVLRDEDRRQQDLSAKMKMMKKSFGNLH